MSKHVLLIEDEPNIIEAISFILSREGLKVETHSDGTTANARLRGARPDLVILDVMLPGDSGLVLCQRLRIEHSMAIIMLTANSEPEYVVEARDRGVTEFLAKPFTVDSLYRRLVSVIARPRPFVNAEQYFGPDRRRRRPFPGRTPTGPPSGH